MIHLGSGELIEHVHGGCEQDTLIGLTRFPAKDLREKRLAHSRVANENKIRTLADEGEIEQT